MYVRQEVISSGWTDLGQISIADVAWATSEFATAIVEAIATTICLRADLPYGTPNIEMRFYGTATDADSNTINIYGKRDNDDYYQLLATLTLVMGTAQKGAATELWADGITEDKDFTPEIAGGVVHVNDNSIGRYFFKSGGYKSIAVIATTLGSTDIGIEIAAYSG